MTAEQQPELSGTERAMANLLQGPFDKVSITMPAYLRARVAARSTGSTFSSYVSEVLAREERRLALVEFLDYMDDLYGSPTPEERADTDRRVEEMWARFDASQ
jgi:hypothetical protein